MTTPTSTPQLAIMKADEHGRADPPGDSKAGIPMRGELRRTARAEQGISTLESTLRCSGSSPSYEIYAPLLHHFCTKTAGNGRSRPETSNRCVN